MRRKFLFLFILFFSLSFNVNALEDNDIMEREIDKNSINTYEDYSDSNGIFEDDVNSLDTSIEANVEGFDLKETTDLIESSENEIAADDDKIVLNDLNDTKNTDNDKAILNDSIEVKNVDNDKNASEVSLALDDDSGIVSSINYQVHAEKIGWQDYKKDGELAGTTGESKRLEAIKISLNDNEYNGSVEYRVHVEKIGWQDYRKDGELAGTTGESKRLEAIQIRLTGDISNVYDVYYRVHAQQYGWLGWAKNDEMAGTSGYSYRLEAIEIKLVNKNSGFNDYNKSFYQHLINYQVHAEKIGWQDYKKDGELAGTTGESKRLEAIKISLNDNEYNGSVEYRVHVEKIGWQDYRKDGELAGTTGESKRLEAIQIRLTGDISNVYDVYYRVHAQQYGWLGWAKNDEMAGTSGYSYRLEAIEIKLAKKDEIIESERLAYYQDYIRYNTSIEKIGWQGYVADGATSGTTGECLAAQAIQIYLVNPAFDGSIVYKSYINGYGWEEDFRANGQTSGVYNGDKYLEAIKIELTGRMKDNYDVYYRVHSQKVGWLDWAKNGEIAGTNGYNYRVEAIEIKLIKIGEETPDINGNSFIYAEDGKCIIESMLNQDKVIDLYYGLLKENSNVSLHDRINTLAQIWYIKKLPSNYYMISSSINPNMFLTADNLNVTVQSYNDSDNQLWSIVHDGNDAFLLISKYNNLYVTVENGRNENETNIILSEKLNSDWQRFNIIQFNDRLIYNGIDISSHQNNIIWDDVAREVNFVIIRAGYGNDELQQDDKKFLENVRYCEEHNIPYGIYIYSYALNEQEAMSEASHALRLLKNTGKNFLLGVWFDMEDADGYKSRHGMPSNQTLVNICNTFGTIVETAGYKVGIYASLSWLNNQLNSPILNKYDKWVAHWNGPVTYDSARNTSTSYGGNYSMWQFCSDGILNGISGYIDMNLGYDLYSL